MTNHVLTQSSAAPFLLRFSSSNCRRRQVPPAPVFPSGRRRLIVINDLGPFLYFLSHRDEGLLDVEGLLGGGLHELHAEGIGVLLALGLGYLALIFEIALVANEELDDIVIGVLLDLFEPVFDILESLLVGHVIHEDDPMSTLIIARGDRLEALLAGGIPDLKFHRFSLEIEGSDLKIDANGR